MVIALYHEGGHLLSWHEKSPAPSGAEIDFKIMWNFNWICTIYKHETGQENMMNKNISLGAKSKFIIINRVDKYGLLITQTAMIKNLRKNYPLSKIEMLTTREGQRFYKGNPYGIETHNINGKAIKAENRNYDVSLAIEVTEKDYFNLVNKHCLNIQANIGYKEMSGLSLGRFPDGLEDYCRKITDHSAFYKDISDESTYIGISYLRNLLPLGIEEKDCKPEVWSSGAEINRISRYLNDQNIKGGEFILGVNIDSVSNVWPEEDIAKVIMLFAKNDQKIKNMKYLATYSQKGADKFYNLSRILSAFNIPLIGVPKMTYGELGALIKRMSYFISADTGPAHVAQATGTPATIIYPCEEQKNYWMCPDPSIKIQPLISKCSSRINLINIPSEEVYEASLNGIEKWATERRDI